MKRADVAKEFGHPISGSDFDRELVEGSYKNVLNVSPGIYSCKYYPKWATAVIKKK